MDNVNAKKLEELGWAFAFIGNSLLKPMNQTSALGLEPVFWESFPSFDNAVVTEGINTLTAYGNLAHEIDEEQAISQCSTELTDLFINGGSDDFVAPWETVESGCETAVGFGKATIDMRDKLKTQGLTVGACGNQFEDHIGVELLYLASLCEKVAANELDIAAWSQNVNAFFEAHPILWVEDLSNKVHNVRPNGYIDGLLSIAKGLLYTAQQYSAETVAQ